MSGKTTGSAITPHLRVTVERQPPDERDWPALGDSTASDHEFASRAWYLSWEAAFLPVERWRGPITWIVARADDGTCLGTIPLARQSWPGMAFSSLAGYYFPFRTLPLPVSPAQLTRVAEAIVEHLEQSRNNTPWRMGPVVRDHPTVVALSAAFQRRGWTVFERPLGRTHAVKFDGDFDAYLRGVGPHLIKKNSYFERRLRKQGDVNISVLEFSHGAAASHFDELAALERKSWVAADPAAVFKFADVRSRTFWNTLYEYGAFAKRVRVWVVRFNETIISYSLNLDAGDTRYTLANGYDKDFATHSPGTILAYHILKDAWESGVRTLEWGLGDSGYKRRWGAAPNLALADLIVVAPQMLRRLPVGLLARRTGFSEVPLS